MIDTRVADFEIAAERLRRWRTEPLAFVNDLWPSFVPEPWQEEFWTYCVREDQHKRVSLQACVGVGKGCAKSATIYTPDGKRLWGDLQEGDCVWGLRGETATIVRRHADQTKQMYRVTCDDGSSTEVWGDHLWRVRELCRPEKWQVLSTEQLIENGVHIYGHRHWGLPVQPECRGGSSHLPCDPYFLGVWLGDGLADGYGICKPYPELRDRLIERGLECGEYRACGIIFSCNQRPALKELGLLGHRSWERFVPEIAFSCSLEDRWQILCGLLDTDGDIGFNNATISFNSTSLALIEGAINLARSCGGKAREPVERQTSYTYKGEKKLGRVSWRTTMCLPRNPFCIPHKAERWNDPQDRYRTRVIESIEPTGIEDGFCIEVDDPDHCYLGPEWIPTHNTAGMTIEAWRRLLCYGRPPNLWPRGAAVAIDMKNLSANFWAEMAKWRSSAPILEQLFTQTAEKISRKGKEQEWFLEARGWSKRADSEEQGRTLSGLHSPFVSVYADESATIPLSVIQTATQIESSCEDSLIVQAGNPTSQEGCLYDASVRNRDRWFVLEITGDPDDPKRCTRMGLEWAQEQIDVKGRDHPWVQAMVLGLFPRGGINQLLTIDDVNSAMKRSIKKSDFEMAPVILSADVARGGLDSSVITRRQGKMVFPQIQVASNIDGIQGAARMALLFNQHKADAIFVDDTGGWGGSWIDQLRHLGFSPIGVQYAGKPIDPGFGNKRAEMWWQAAEAVKGGACLPDSPSLRDDLVTPLYFHKGDKLFIESKEDIKARLQRSPDFGDSYVQTYAFPVGVKRTNENRMLPWARDVPGRDSMCVFDNHQDSVDW